MTHPGRRRIRTMTTAATAALILVLAGCSSDDPGPDSAANPADGHPTDVLAQLSEIAKSAAAGHDVDADFEDLFGDTDAADGGGDGSGDDSTSAEEWHPLTWRIPVEAAVPDGFHYYPTACEAPELDATERTEWISYSVPETWHMYGKSSGSGSPLDDSSRATFQVGDGNSHNDFRVEFTPDTLAPDRSTDSGWVVVDHNKEPWTTFDYTYTVGDTSYEITHEVVATATVGDQTVDVWLADQAQAPEALNSSKYLARVVLAEVPTMPATMPGETPPWRDASTVVSIEFDADSERADPVDPETAAAIISSLTIPDCGVQYVVATHEHRLQIDLDGDGKVTTQEEMAAVMRGEG